MDEILFDQNKCGKYIMYNNKLIEWSDENIPIVNVNVLMLDYFHKVCTEDLSLELLEPNSISYSNSTGIYYDYIYTYIQTSKSSFVDITFEYTSVNVITRVIGAEKYTQNKCSIIITMYHDDNDSRYEIVVYDYPAFDTIVDYILRKKQIKRV